MNKFFILNISGLPILEQLQLEEALLRADQGNWCLINQGSSDAIVMGISGKVESLLHQEKVGKIPIIRRFSGGGTVYVDQETLFVTFIANEANPSPRKIMEWTERLYKPFFAPHPFALKENDYTMGEKKFGGNAQYMQKGRWLHHTSFLWDYQKEKMALLKLPPKRPLYRQDRSHDHFLTTLAHYYQDKEEFVKKLSSYLQEQLSAEVLAFDEVVKVKERPHRKATCYWQ